MLNYSCTVMWKVVLRTSKRHSSGFSQSWSSSNLYLTLAGEFHLTCSVTYLNDLVLFPQNQLLQKYIHSYSHIFMKKYIITYLCHT